MDANGEMIEFKDLRGGQLSPSVVPVWIPPTDLLFSQQTVRDNQQVPTSQDVMSLERDSLPIFYFIISNKEIFFEI